MYSSSPKLMAEKARIKASLGNFLEKRIRKREERQAKYQSLKKQCEKAKDQETSKACSKLAY
jgi:hypothetical protein